MLKVIFATLVIFGAGMVVGGLVARNAPAAKTSAQRGQNMSPGQGELRGLLRRMDRELELSADQHERIQKIIEASQGRTQDLWKPVALEINKVTTKVCDDIRDQLTPEQQAKFDTFSRNRPDHGGEHGERGDRGRRGRPPGTGPMGPTNRSGATSSPD